jgi:hypothetical protein
MKERWLPVGILAGVLFVINALGRVVAKLWADGNEQRETNAGYVALALICLVMIAAAVRWVRRYPTPRVWWDFAVAAVAGCLLSVLIGPFIVGDQPFAEGAGIFFRQIWWYLGLTLGGAGFGALVVMTLGQDWKSQAWKRYAEQNRNRPRKVVRR